MSEEKDNGGGKVFVVKNWHVVLTLLLWIVTAVASYATLRAQSEEDHAEIQRMKTDHVSKERFDELKEDILRRLQRIEDKLDRDRALKELH